MQFQINFHNHLSSRICWLLLALLALLGGCRNSTEPNNDFNIDHDIPPSEAFDASYGFWGPEGETIYFTHSKELGSNPDPGLLDQLWKVDVDNIDNRQMIHTGRILNADISPDGQWFVFQSFFPPQYLYKIKSDGSQLQRLTGPDSPNPEREYTIGGRWSKNGNQILFSLSAGVPRGIAIMDSSGSNPTIIIPYGVEPSWSPDGDQIIYLNWDTTKVRKNQEQIYIANADGSNPQKITDLKNTYFNIHDPTFTPSSTKIAFTYSDELYTMKLNEGSVNQLTEGPGYVVRPEWSPDGKTILFSRIIQNVSKRLYYMDIATHEVTPVFPE